MRKTLLLATILLLGSMGAAQAQEATIARVTLLTSTERAAREGGKNEAAGDVFLDITGTPGSIASYTLTYSVPVSHSYGSRPRDGYARSWRATWKKDWLHSEALTKVL